jgi:hypothetical protein
MRLISAIDETIHKAKLSLKNTIETFPSVSVPMMMRQSHARR